MSTTKHNNIAMCIKTTVKSLFSASVLIYLNPCQNTGAKKRTALKRGKPLIFQSQINDRKSQINDLVLLKTTNQFSVKDEKRREVKTLENPETRSPGDERARR